jgi:hypothetical protein
MVHNGEGRPVTTFCLWYHPSDYQPAPPATKSLTTSVGAVRGPLRGASKPRRRRWRRRSKPTTSACVGATVDHVCEAATSFADRSFVEPDPLMFEVCMSAGPPAWVGPMLEEFVASLIVSRPVEARTPGRLFATGPVSLVVDASVADDHLPEEAAECTAVSPLLSPV